MKITRRRKRKLDTLASPDWVRSIFDQLKRAFPGISSYTEKDLVKLARAVRHVERYSATDSQRGRPSRWPREELLKVGSSLSAILERETQGRISLATFVDHYIRILDFPSDVLESLSKGSINLFEAEQLSRVTSKRLNITTSEARQKRAELALAHLRARLSGERLRRRINELLGNRSLAPGTMDRSTEAEVIENLEDFESYDTTHLFWEEIKQLGFAFRNIRREDLTDDLIDDLIKASEPIWAVLQRIEQRKAQVRRTKPLL
jgi:hypothetical protein